MDIEMFNKVVERRLDKVHETLIKKAAEYANGGDRLHNFKKGVLMNGKAVTPAQLLKGFKLKHDISVDDMIEGQTKVTPYLIDEKIGDQVCYAILLEAIFWEEVGGLPLDKSLNSIDGEYESPCGTFSINPQWHRVRHRLPEVGLSYKEKIATKKVKK